MSRTSFGAIRIVAALGAVSLGAALGATGCSSSPGKPQLDSGDAGLSASPSPTGSAGIGAGQGVDGTAMATRVRAAMSGSGSARFSLESSTTSGQDASGILNFSGGTIRVSLDFADGGDRLRVVALPGVLYADVGEVVDGKHWLKVTAGAKDPVSTAMEPLLSYMTNSADISTQAGSWSAASGFTVAGHTTIGDAPATEYDATIPQSAVQANLPPQFREVMQKDVTGDSRLRLWLDAQGRPLRLATSGSYAGKPDLVTVTYTEWGAAPAVVAPSSADVIAPPG